MKKLLAILLLLPVLAYGQIGRTIKTQHVYEDTTESNTASAFWFLRDSARFANYARFDSTGFPTSAMSAGWGRLIGRGDSGIYYQHLGGRWRLDTNFISLGKMDTVQETDNTPIVTSVRNLKFTSDNLSVTSGTNTAAVNTIQDIGLAASPTFQSLNLSAVSAGGSGPGIPYSDATGLIEQAITNASRGRLLYSQGAAANFLPIWTPYPFLYASGSNLGFGLTDTSVNKNISTTAQSQDTASAYFSSSTTGKPQFEMRGITGNRVAAIDTSGTIFGGGAIFGPGIGTSFITFNNATTGAKKLKMVYDGNQLVINDSATGINTLLNINDSLNSVAIGTSNSYQTALRVDGDRVGPDSTQSKTIWSQKTMRGSVTDAHTGVFALDYNRNTSPTSELAGIGAFVYRDTAGVAGNVHAGDFHTQVDSVASASTYLNVGVAVGMHNEKLNPTRTYGVWVWSGVHNSIDNPTSGTDGLLISGGKNNKGGWHNAFTYMLPNGAREDTGVTAFQIDSLGHVGIGTATSSSSLDVVGNGTSHVLIGDGGVTNFGSISLNGSLAANQYNLTSGSGQNLYINVPTSKNINFRTNNGSDQITIANGLVTRYNSIATEGYGLPAIVDTVERTAQAGNISATALNGTTAGAAYEVDYYLACTTASGTATVTLTLDWDNNGKSITSSSVSMASTANYAQDVVSIRNIPSAGSSIRYSTTVSGTIGAAQYFIHVVAKRLD